MRKHRFIALLSAALLLGGCDLMVPDYNNPSLEQLQNNPTPSLVNTAATGLLIGARSNISGAAGYVSLLGVLGRESFVLDGSDPRYVTSLLVGPLDPGGFIGGGLFFAPYTNIRNANILLAALESPNLVGFSDAEKEALRGFAKTIKALEYLRVINTRDTNGAPVEVDIDVNAEPAPIENKEVVFAYIEQLLNEAAEHLRNGGDHFTFPLGAGYEGFDTPLTFLTFNRALKARVDVFTGDYTEALQALDASFLDLSQPLDYGVYYEFGSGSGDQLNGIATSSTIYANPAIVQNAQLQPSGELDQRVLDKTEPLDAPVTVQGVTTQYGFTIYETIDAPIPIIRNAGLILLRAETRWFTGDKAGAISDLNVVRTQAGGLAPVQASAINGDEEFVTALLYERRYTLLLEGGFSLIDARRFGRLDQLPVLPGQNVISKFPIPRDECNARGVAGDCNESNA